MVAGIGGFGGQFPLDTSRYEHPVLVASTDGVGTKLEVARATGRYETVGIDLVAMCVDDLVCVGAEPLFLLDYVVTGRVDPDRVATVVSGIHEGCRLAGCALIGGETAEHPGVMAPDDLDLAGFAVGIVEDGTQLGPERVRAGDAVVGLASPGLRSNGYTLARHVLLERAGRVPRRPGLGGRGADGGRRASAAVRRLHPRRAGGARGGSVPRCAPAPMSRAGGSWATCRGRSRPSSARSSTGPVGASPGCSRRSNACGEVEEAEMDRVFNRGVGMALVVDPAAVGEVLDVLASAGQPSTVIGSVVAGAPGVRFA